MRPRGQIVHFGGGRGSALCSLLHQGVDLVRRPHGPLAESFDKDAFLLVFSDLERCPLDLEQIGYDLVVYLQVADTNHESGILVGLHLDEFEYFLHAPRNDSTLGIANVVLESLHGVSLARSGLSVGKHCRIVALEHRNH